MELYELIELLNRSHGPSGDESGVREMIEKLARPYADEVQTDVMGNLIAHKWGPGPKVMIAAHMDSTGFVVTHIEKQGFLRVGKLGGISAKQVVYTPVRFANGVRGSLVPEERADMGKLTLDACYLDIGAKSEDDARTMVRLGDSAVYDTFTRRNGSKVISPYIDDRIGCAILLKAIEEMQCPRNDFYFVFTTQEEIGTRGVKTATWSIDPDYGIVMDVTDVDDTPGSEKSGTTQLGKGAAIKLMDESVVCHPAVVALLDQTADKAGIPVQRDIIRTGGSDAGTIHTTRAGVLTGGISVPCRYIHTPVEMADLDDADACLRLVLALGRAELIKP